MICKLKSKGSGESEYSSKLRKDLLKAFKIIEGLQQKMEKEKIILSSKKEDQKISEMLEEMDHEIKVQKELEIKSQQERKARVEEEMRKKRDERIAQTITTRIPGCYTPNKKPQPTKAKNDNSQITPTEFKFNDNRIDFVVDKNENAFDEDINDRIEEQDSEFETEPIIELEKEEIEPTQFNIGDNRFEVNVNKNESDAFSQSEQDEDMSCTSEVAGIFQYAQKFDGDQHFRPPTPSENEISVANKEVKMDLARHPDEESKYEESKQIEGSPNIKQLVDATINAWNSCPSIVKKQLDQQYSVIKIYKEQIEDLQYKLGLRVKEFEQRINIDSVKDLEKKKRELERQNILILEKEKKRIVEMRLKEMHELKKENKDLDLENQRLKLLLRKYKK